MEIKYEGSPKLIQFEVMNSTMVAQGSSVIVGIHLRRMYTFHLANTFFPTLCLIVIVEITLFIDDSNFDTNVMVALTTLLVMYTLFQSISNTLPQTAYLKLIDMWLLFSLILPFIIFMFHMIWEVEKVRTQKLLEVKPSWLGQRSKSTERENNPHKCKAMSQVLVPLFTSLFIIGYWIYALHVFNINI